MPTSTSTPQTHHDDAQALRVSSSSSSSSSSLLLQRQKTLQSPPLTITSLPLQNSSLTQTSSLSFIDATDLFSISTERLIKAFACNNNINNNNNNNNIITPPIAKVVRPLPEGTKLIRTLKRSRKIRRNIKVNNTNNYNSNPNNNINNHHQHNNHHTEKSEKSSTTTLKSSIIIFGKPLKKYRKRNNPKKLNNNNNYNNSNNNNLKIKPYPRNYYYPRMSATTVSRQTKFSQTNNYKPTKQPTITITKTATTTKTTQWWWWWWLNYYSPRFLTLFLLGSLTSFVIDHLLTQNRITEYPKDITKLIDTAAWIPPTCGLSAVLVGTLFPLADYWLRIRPQESQKEWSNVMRCMGGFIGIAYAATKLTWNSNYQVSCTLTLISICLWFLFDRTLHGFFMSSVFAFIGTGVMYALISNGIYSITHADFFGLRSWMPCVLYSSSVCFGTMGRQLMVIPEEWFDDEIGSDNNNKSYYS